MNTTVTERTVAETTGPAPYIDSQDRQDRLVRIEVMLRHMLQMQESSNSSLFPDWKEQGFRWITATVVEGAELIDHLHWKWWKAGDSDFGQAQMEAVDIWHFFLSRLILQEPGLLYKRREDVPEGDVASYFQAGFILRYAATQVLLARTYSGEASVSGAISATESFLRATLHQEYSTLDSLPYFTRLLVSLGMSFDGLYKKYIAKNMLNGFRWANGYKSGEYVKDWLGEEDNQFLTKIVEGSDLVGQELEAYIQEALRRRYSEVQAAIIASL